MTEVSRTYYKTYGLRPRYMDLSGSTGGEGDELSALSNTRRRRNYALQESLNLGEPYIFSPAPGISSWVVALENRRMVHGGSMGGEVLIQDLSETKEETLDYLVSHGMGQKQAEAFLAGLPVWSETRVKEAAEFLRSTFYQISGWKPDLMRENRLKAQQQEQINEAIEDQRKSGKQAIYAFEKERILLANIRAGDRNGARRILNEMLAAIYMSSPQLVVLRARSIELMTCLTRAAIEDNPLLEPLIESNHAWTEQLVRARSFEDLSQVLMSALDDFIEGIYLQGVNRSNPKVSKALDFIGRNFSRKISLQSVANEVGLSLCRLSHLMKEFTGKTVLQIIQQVRIRHAQQLLEKTSMGCAEIAYEVGFGDQSYFIKHFRRVIGMTPARYRRSRNALAAGRPRETAA
jgi:YesN/AraC family two-component response regulator